jgi:hypothetical protein
MQAIAAQEAQQRKAEMDSLADQQPSDLHCALQTPGVEARAENSFEATAGRCYLDQREWMGIQLAERGRGRREGFW